MQWTIDIVSPSLKKYVGLRFAIEDQFQRAEHMAFTFANECLAGAHTPFGRMSRNGLLLCDETRATLYDTDFGRDTAPYTLGRHTVLEKYIDSLITASMSDGEKVIALSQSMHYHLPTCYPKVPVFLYGESDEHTLLKGGGHCSCRGRLLSAMCQMIGIPARPAFQWTWRDKNSATPDKLLGGHTVAEVYIDGRWGFFDPQHHLYCMDKQGRFFSIDDIRANPEYFTHMPESIIADMGAVGYEGELGDRTLFEYYFYKNFSQQCPIQISRHNVNGPYLGSWTWATPKLREGQQHDTKRHLEILNALASKNAITDAIYQMGLTEFREMFDINDGQLTSQADADFVGHARHTPASV